jgi:ABC-type Mn2+/Zn2+ transport system permease subunit
VLGIYTSYWLDASTAGCIVVVQTLQFLVVMALAPRHGLLAQRASRLSSGGIRG